MSRAAFQKGSHLWGSEFSPGAPRSALSFGMDFTRAIFSSGVTGAFFENARATKEPGAPNGAMNGDDFLFDDLSMFSNEDIAAPISSLKLNFPICQTSDSSIAMSETVSSGALHEKSSSQATNMLIEPSLHNCKDALAPSREMTELEGFSTFGEDALIFGGSNFRGDSFLIQGVREFSYGSRIVDDAREEQGPIESSKDNIVSTHEKHAESGNEVFALESPVPGRSRSKRSRSGARIWSSGVLYENNPGLSNLTTPSQPLCLSDFQYLSQSEADRDELSDVEPLAPVQRGETSSNTKKAGSKASKKKKNQENGQARRCAHCLSQKTPQWRAGPTGPKTLCNACGVRFKSGRLFPEYMPAKSPTFSTHRHSNSHRKVLEMRHQKEVEVFKKQTLDYNGRHRLSGVDQSYGAGSYNDQRSIDQSYGVPRDDRKTDVHTHYTNHELTV